MKLLKLYFAFEIIDGIIYLKKGLLFRRRSVMQLSAVTKAVVRRTLVMRLLRIKEVTVFVFGGKLRFYLPRGEALPFAPSEAPRIRPRFRDVLFGAFIDTRALGGITVFAAALRRISRIFGETPVRRIRELLELTAAKAEAMLVIFRAAVPRILLTAAAFALAGWAFVYVSRVLSLARFRISESRGRIFISSGFITLYEYILVPNSAAVSCDTLTTIISRRAPLYLHGEMLLPCVRREKLPKTLKRLCGGITAAPPVNPPKRAFLGHIAAPLAFAVIFASGALIAPLDTVRTLMTFGALYCLFVGALFLLYMRRSGLADGERFTVIAARKGLRLYTAVTRSENIISRKRSQSVFQKRAGRFNLKLRLIGRLKLTLRNIERL